MLFFQQKSPQAVKVAWFPSQWQSLSGNAALTWDEDWSKLEFFQSTLKVVKKNFFFKTLHSLCQLPPQLLLLPSSWYVLGLVLWQLPPVRNWLRHKTLTNSYRSCLSLTQTVRVRPKAELCEDTFADETCTDWIDMTGTGGTAVSALMFVPLREFPIQVDLYHTMVHQAEQTENRGVIRQSGAPLLKENIRR